MPENRTKTNYIHLCNYLSKKKGLFNALHTITLNHTEKHGGKK